MSSFFFFITRPPPRSTLFPYTTLFRSSQVPIIVLSVRGGDADKVTALELGADDYLTKPFSMAELIVRVRVALRHVARAAGDRKSTRLNSSHMSISYAVFCLKKKKKNKK